MNLRIFWLLAASTAAVAQPPATGPTQPVAARIVCISRPAACATYLGAPGRFDALVQQWLVRQQLAAQPRDWELIDVYLPSATPQTLEELQIQLLQQLQARTP
jgi:hypothetical protein